MSVYVMQLCKSNAVELIEVSAEDIDEKLIDKEEDFVTIHNTIATASSPLV